MEEKKFKERQNDRGETVNFLDGYKYLGKEYLQEELDVPKMKRAGLLLLDLDIDGLNSMSDLMKINPRKVISAIFKNDLVSMALSIILDEKKGAVIQPSVKEDFDVGLARNFKPFAIKVFADFFTLNSALYGGTAGFVKEVKDLVGLVKNQIVTAKNQLTNSSSSPKEKPKRSNKPKR